MCLYIIFTCTKTGMAAAAAAGRDAGILAVGVPRRPPCTAWNHTATPPPSGSILRHAGEHWPLYIIGDAGARWVLGRPEMAQAILAQSDSSSRGSSRFRAVPFPPVGSGAPAAAAGTAQVVTLNGPFVQVRKPTLIVESADAVSFFLVAHGGPLRDTNR